MPEDSLKPYREKRDFAATPEPSPQAAVQENASEKQIFVIQEHDARNHHYDFRLEVNGVLKSWAVPKGPTTDPKVKRLAIMTEDHPLGYARFEGIIPEGQYGAGTVVVWDIGHYRNMTEKDGQKISMAEALDKGHASFWLEGRKLKGGYALTRTGRGWILVKMKDKEANVRDILIAEPGSALSNRTIEEIAEELDPKNTKKRNSGSSRAEGQKYSQEPNILYLSSGLIKYSIHPLAKLNFEA